jgi:inner membrane protein
MDWWIWLVFGLVLLVLEVLTPSGLYLFFLATAALIVGAIEGALFSMQSWLQWLLFSIFSVISLIFIRQKVFKLMLSDAVPDRDSLIGGEAKASQQIPPSGEGKVSMRGTAWNAVNIGDTELLEHDKCIVDKVNGLTLLVKKI